MRRALGSLSMGLAASMACGISEYQCQDDQQCASAGAGGQCEASGYCSVLDDDCDSGRRYTPLSGDLAGQCVSDPTSTMTEGSSGPGPQTTSGPSSEEGTTLGVEDESGPPPQTTTLSEETGIDSGPAESTDTGSSSGDPQPSCAPVIVEPFDGSRIDPYWAGASDPSIAQQEGSLVFTFGPMAGWHAVSADEGMLVDQTNACVAIEIEAHPEISGAAGNLELAQDAEVVMWNLSAGQLVTWADDSINPGWGQPYDPVLHRWLGLCVVDGTLSWRYSADGISWSVAASAPAPAWLSSAEVRLSANAWMELAEPETFAIDTFTRCEY